MLNDRKSRENCCPRLFPYIIPKKLSHYTHYPIDKQDCVGYNGDKEISGGVTAKAVHCSDGAVTKEW